MEDEEQHELRVSVCLYRIAVMSGRVGRTELLKITATSSRVLVKRERPCTFKAWPDTNATHFMTLYDKQMHDFKKKKNKACTQLSAVCHGKVCRQVYLSRCSLRVST